MAPKTLPTRELDGRYTFWGAPSDNFSTFAAVYNPETFRELLWTRQKEQLSMRLWHGVADFPPNMQVAPGPVLLRVLPLLASTLYPGREHPHLWTPFELSLVQMTMFQLVFRRPLLPRILDANEMCTFMVWVTFPSELLVARLQGTLHGQPFTLQGADCTWGSNGYLNFSFSPRSALLMFFFGLSIRRQQGQPDLAHMSMATTLGFRLSWRRWGELLAASSVWNRRYVDYFVALSGTLQLAHQVDAATLQSMVTLVHPVAPYMGVDAMNDLLSRPNGNFYRLFHLPIPAHAWGTVLSSPWWDSVPRELLQHFARPRL